MRKMRKTSLVRDLLDGPVRFHEERAGAFEPPFEYESMHGLAEERFEVAFEAKLVGPHGARKLGKCRRVGQT